MFQDVMVDVETTGTNSNDAAVIQIAAVRFNLETREIDLANVFDRSPAMLPRRYWDEGTRHWWSEQNREVLEGIYARMEPGEKVWRDFVAWAGYGGMRFWAKPTSFDFTMVSSHLSQLDLQNPFSFRDAVDVNSFIRGLQASPVLYKRDFIEFVGDAHDALTDVINQINNVFAAVDELRPPRGVNLTNSQGETLGVITSVEIIDGE